MPISTLDCFLLLPNDQTYMNEVLGMGAINWIDIDMDKLMVLAVAVCTKKLEYRVIEWFNCQIDLRYYILLEYFSSEC